MKAFPRPLSTDDHSTQCNVSMDQEGMDLRDWFAGMALIALGDKPSVTETEMRAQLAYQQASDMLMERTRWVKQ